MFMKRMKKNKNICEWPRMESK